MLMVTTTVRMLDGVHGNTSNSGPVVALSLVLVPGGVGTEKRLVGSLTAGGDTNHGSAVAHDGLTGAGGELDTGLAALIGVTNDDAGSAGSSGEGAAVTDLALAVGDDGTLGHRVHGKNVSHGKRGLGTSVNELAGVHALDGNEVFNSLLVPVRVSEDNLGKWGTSARVMNDVLDNSLDIALLLNIVKSSEPGRRHFVCFVRRKDKTTTVSLRSNTSTHD